MPDAPVPATGANITVAALPANGQQSAPPVVSQKDRAAQQVEQQEHQRILGVVPNFNTSYVQDAAPLSRKQKLSLAFKSATDVGNILVAAADAAYNEWTDQFPEYGEGMKGYAKYLGASYADAFDGTMLGNAIFPILLKQDPRFFRKGTGSFNSRLFYAVGTTFWCKNDSGSRGPNYSNLLGNLAAGGISNLYYPASDRGAGFDLRARLYCHCGRCPRRRFRRILAGHRAQDIEEPHAQPAAKCASAGVDSAFPSASLANSVEQAAFHFKSITTIRPSD